MAFEKITLDVNANGIMQTFHSKQYDVGRPIIIDLVAGEDAYTPAAGVTFELHCRKVDFNLVVITDYEIDGNQITFATTEQLTACVGDNLATLKLFKDGLEIATMNFILNVTIDPDAQGIISESEIDNLTTQIEEITEQVIGDNYYDKTETDALLDLKADAADVYTKTETDTLLSDKADKSDTYTKTQVDTALALKADKSDTYTKAQVDSALYEKADTADLATVATTGDYDDLINKPTIPAAQVQSDWDQSDDTKVDYIKNKPTLPDMSLYYTKTQTDALLDEKADVSDLILAIGVEDQTPYLNREVPASAGNRLLDMIVGGTVAFNQLVNTGDTSINTVSGHKYYTKINSVESIINGGSAVSINDSSVDMVIDLTALFGSSTIADYVYSLESGTAGAGVNWLKAHGFIAKDYYAYNSGTLVSVKPTKHIEIGKNQIKNIMTQRTEYTVLLGQYTDLTYETFLFAGTYTISAVSNKNLTFYYRTPTSSNISISTSNNIGTFTFNDNCYVKLWAYNSVALSVDDITNVQLEFGSTPTAYEPYTKHEYTLNGGDLYGLFKLDANNNLYADGNTYKSNGEVGLYYEQRAYQSGDERLPNAITDGTNTVVKLATHTTTTADPFTNPQVCENGGSEEYTDTRAYAVPVGHDTIYQKKTDYRYW